MEHIGTIDDREFRFFGRIAFELLNGLEIAIMRLVGKFSQIGSWWMVLLFGALVACTGTPVSQVRFRKFVFWGRQERSCLRAPCGSLTWIAATPTVR